MYVNGFLMTSCSHALWPYARHTHSHTPQNRYFPRQGYLPPKSGFTDSFTGSLGTLPQATNTYLRSLQLASAYSDAVVALNRQLPRLWVLQSSASVAINVNATTDFLGAFEPAVLLGVKVGMLDEHSSMHHVQDDDVVVVSGQTHVSDYTVQWLQARVASASSKGTVVVCVDPEATTQSLQFNESGVERDAHQREFLNSLPQIPLVSVDGALQAMRTVRCAFKCN